VRERWFGATGRKVPEIALEDEFDVSEALVLDAWEDSAHGAFEPGRPSRSEEHTSELQSHA